MSAAGPDVIAQLGAMLPAGSTATLAARDGSTTSDIAGQLGTVPKDATHLVISVGGNNALGEKGLIEEKAQSVAEVLDKLAKIKAAFRKSYAAMLDGVLARETADRNLHHLRGALPGPHHAGDRGDWLERVQRRDLCARRSRARCR